MITEIRLLLKPSFPVCCNLCREWELREGSFLRGVLARLSRSQVPTRGRPGFRFFPSPSLTRRVNRLLSLARRVSEGSVELDTFEFPDRLEFPIENEERGRIQSRRRRTFLHPPWGGGTFLWCTPKKARRRRAEGEGPKPGTGRDLCFPTPNTGLAMPDFFGLHPKKVPF